MDKHYILVIILFVISFLIIRQSFNPKNETINRGYSHEGDTLKTALDRVQWSNHYTGRVNICVRLLFYAIFLTMATNIIFTGGNASGKTFMQSVIIIWIILLMLSSYFSHHSDKFSSYCIDKNLNIIRKKLNVEPYDHETVKTSLSKSESKVKGTHGCFTFFYKVK